MQVRQDSASNLQLVIATPNPDLTMLSAAIDLGRRAGLSAQELASASHFLELQQDLPRLIAAKQPAALQVITLSFVISDRNMLHMFIVHCGCSVLSELVGPCQSCELASEPQREG